MVKSSSWSRRQLGENRLRAPAPQEKKVGAGVEEI